MRVLLLGATGTIGQATARALVRHGHHVICPVRERKISNRAINMASYAAMLPGTELHLLPAGTDLAIDATALERDRVDVIVSCLASRTGTPTDAWRVDYGLHAALLQQALAANIQHFVLLSAICVQKPLLGFQQAKLAFESELVASGIRHSIVRPTAFFKSLSGQLRRVQAGKPYLLFGDGKLTACKPISDQDLGNFMASCLHEHDKHDRILPVGGPGDAITPLEQAEYLFKRLGKPTQYRHVPVALLDSVIGLLRLSGYVIPRLADKAELAKIGRYYATESMLVWDRAASRYDAAATPSYGEQHLFEYYDRLITGQEKVVLGDHAVF
jgi:divinyl chlorophyllide a 8-vinyl-reductase